MAGAERDTSSLYATLGLACTAAAAEIRAAYKRQALRWHPDKGGSAEAFRAVVHAFDVLSSPCARCAYDAQLARREERRRRAAAAAAAQQAASAHGRGGGGLKRRAGAPAAGGCAPTACGAALAQPAKPAETTKEARPPGRRSLEVTLHRRLARLEAVLALCPAPVRRAAIEGMSQPLRRVLVGFIEKRRACPDAALSREEAMAKESACAGSIGAAGPGLQLAAGAADSSGEEEAPPRILALGDGAEDSASASEESEAGSVLAIEDMELQEASPWTPTSKAVCDVVSHAEDSLPGSDPAEQAACGAEDGAGTPRTRTSRTPQHASRRCGKLRGINEVRAKGNYLYYDARVSFRNLTLASRLTRSLEEAVHFHLCLATVRQRVQELEEEARVRQEEASEPAAQVAEASRRFEASVARALAETEGLEGMGLTFQVVMDARQWIGRMVASPRMCALEEVLSTWRRAESARLAGWPALRGLWLQWMQVERRARWGIHTRSAEEAEAYATAAETGYAAEREQKAARATEREARQQARLEARELRGRLRAERGARREAAARERQMALVEVLLPRRLTSAEKAVRAKEARSGRLARAAARRAHCEWRRQQRVVALERRRAGRRAELARKAARRRWLRADLTMDELRGGFRG